MAADTYEVPKHGWTCFFCGETFKTVGAATDHFGHAQHATPGCLIDFRVQTEEGGKPERGRGLLMALRKAELELDAYRQEDTLLHRAMYAMQCEHRQALIREEEKGYARGLRDGVNLPADSPERAALAAVPGTYTPSREVVQQALDLLDRIRDSHAYWGGWSGIPQTCERITNMLRYGTADGVEGPKQWLTQR